jgi:uncharacterized protein (DUF362 family)/Pyruvate/2-oxoacid:ferredoxin oxidoreductase delta subunit
MDKSKVALVRCDNYDEAAVSKSVRSGIDLLGGIGNFVKPGENIVLKPNVLIGSKPEACVTTHPSIFASMIAVLKEAGAKVTYGDSPAFGKAEANMRKSGLQQVADRLGVALAEFDSGRQASCHDALLMKIFLIANGVLDADGLISLPKFKSHGLVRFTGAVKNQFGCIPGLLKSQYHVKLPDPYQFATMLVDLNTLIKPRLFVMDGIVAMEGNGPRNGKPRKMNVLLMSTDPIALDATACRMIDLDPAVVPTSAPGEQSRLGTYHAENIEVIGESIESFKDFAFEIVRTPPDACSGGRLRRLAKNQICERPVIDKKKCTICGTCVRMCPVTPKAVDWHSGDKSKPPTHKYERCIRCFCCQEMCPEGAIFIESPFLGRVLNHR